MKSLIRTALGGNTPGQSRDERKFRAQYSLVVSHEQWGSRMRWEGKLKRDKHNTIQTFSGDSELEIREQAKKAVDILWERQNRPKQKRIHRL